MKEMKDKTLDKYVMKYFHKLVMLNETVNPFATTIARGNLKLRVIVKDGIAMVFFTDKKRTVDEIQEKLRNMVPLKEIQHEAKKDEGNPVGSEA